MKRALITAAVYASLSSTCAFAVDWSLNASLFETIELNNNQLLLSTPHAATLGSYSSIFTDATARTLTSKFTLNGDFTYTKYWGPGTAEMPQTETIAGGANAHYETFGKNGSDRQYIDASWHTTSTQLAILSNLGFSVPAAGNINFATTTAGIERNLTASDFVALSLRSALTYYDPASAGVQFLDTAGNLNWKHQLDAKASVSFTSIDDWLTYQNAQKTNTILLKNKVGVDVALSPLIDVHAAAGAAYVQITQQGPLASLAPISTGILNSGASGSAVGFIGDMSIIYKILKKTTISLTASQSVDPSIVGSLVQGDAFGASLVQSINQSSTLSLFGSFSRQTTSGGVSDFISASIAYNRQLTLEWNANLTYRYLHRSATSGTTTAFDPITGFPLFTSNAPASSNAIILTVSRAVSVLPSGN